MTGIGVGSGGYEGVGWTEGDFVGVERAEGGVTCDAEESAGEDEEETENEAWLECLEGGEVMEVCVGGWA